MRRETWLSPLGEVWQQVYPQSEVPWGQLAKYGHPFTIGVGIERTCAELLGYLKKTPHEYVSLKRWSDTFGTWAVEKPKPVQPATIFREVFDGKRLRLVPDDAA